MSTSSSSVPASADVGPAASSPSLRKLQEEEPSPDFSDIQRSAQADPESAHPHQVSTAKSPPIGLGKAKGPDRQLRSPLPTSLSKASESPFRWLKYGSAFFVLALLVMVSYHAVSLNCEAGDHACFRTNAQRIVDRSMQWCTQLALKQYPWPIPATLLTVTWMAVARVGSKMQVLAKAVFPLLGCFLPFAFSASCLVFYGPGTDLNVTPPIGSVPTE